MKKLVVTATAFLWAEVVRGLTKVFPTTTKDWTRTISLESGAMSEMSDDDYGTTSWWRFYSNARAGDLFQVDMGTTQQIGSIYAVLDHQAVYPLITIYVGETPYSDGSYMTQNKMCYTGNWEGLALCEATGRYIIWQLATDATADRTIYELIVFKETDLAGLSGTTISSTGITLNAASGPLARLLGTTDGSFSSVYGTTSFVFPFTITVTFPSVQMLTEAAIFIRQTGTSNMQTITAKAVYQGVSTTCGKITRDEALLFQSVACGSDLLADKMEFQIVMKTASLYAFYKVGIFGKTCVSKPHTVTEDAYTSGTVIFDLLEDKVMLVALPTLTIWPAPCYTTVWTLYRAADDVDQVAANPLLFAILAPNLRISQTVSTFADRLSKFSSDTYYFTGTTNTHPNRVSSRFPLTISFVDACRSSTIVSKTITLSSAKFNVNSSQALSVFLDTVDQGGQYAQGVCGEKIFTLAPGTPAFLTVTADSADPLTNALTIAYDSALAVETDIKMHTISYTVSSKEYGGSVNLVADIQGTFSFEVLCPDSMLSNSLVTPITASSSYDLASGVAMALAKPVVSVRPATCFTVTSFEITTLAGAAVSYISVGASSIDVFSVDWSVKGVQNFNIVAVVNNGEKVQQHSFAINFYDTCSTLTPVLVESAFSGGSTSFDLLSESTKSIPLPANPMIKPIGCNFSITWKVRRASDDADMTVLLPLNFAISNPNLVVTHSPDNYPWRHSLFSTTSFYFQGTVSDAGATKTTKMSFTIAFQDACRSASVLPQNIVFPSPALNYDLSKSIQVPAFTDSIDASGSYTVGKCGEKLVSLQAGARPFVSLSPDQVDPITKPFTITYDDFKASGTDINIVYDVFYTVKFKEYANVAAALTSSFKFKVICPSLVTHSVLVTAVVSPNTYDTANPSPLFIDAPSVTVSIPQCFQIVNFKISSEGESTQPPFITLSKDLKKIEIATKESAHVGAHSLRIRAVINNGQTLHEHSFKITIIDSCQTAQIVAEQTIGTLTTEAMLDKVLVVTLKAYQDSVSQRYGVKDDCGSLRYSVLKEGGLPAPQYVTVVYFEGKETFQIEVNPKQLLSPVNMWLTLRAELANYPSAPVFEQKFELNVKAPANMWSPPPQPSEVVSSKQEQLPVIVEQESPPEMEVVAPLETAKQQVVTAGALWADSIRARVNKDQKSLPSPVPEMKKVTMTGILEINFSESMIVIPPDIDLAALEFEKSPEQWSPVLTVTCLPIDKDDDLAELGLSWRLIESTPQMLMLQLEFEQPLRISVEEQNTLEVVFADGNLFTTDQGIQIHPENRTLRSQLSKQLPLEAQSIQEMFDAGAQATQAVSMFILLLNVVVGAGLQQIFGMLTALQIIVMFPLLEAQIPANAAQFFHQLLQIAAFDLFEIGDFVDAALGLEQSEPVNAKLESIGFETKQFINNVGTFIFVVFFYALAILTWCVLTVAGKFYDRPELLGIRLGKYLFWQKIVKTVDQSFLIICLCSFITFKHNLSFACLGQGFHSFMAVITFAAYSIILSITLLGLTLNFPAWDQARGAAASNKFGFFLKGLNVKRGRKILLEPITFLVLRVFFATLVIYGTEVFIYQMIQVFGALLLFIVMTYVTQAIQFGAQRRLETFSRVTVLLCSYCFLLFNMVDDETNFKVGYVAMLTTSAYIAINLALILRGVYSANIIACKVRYALRKHARNRKKLQSALRISRPNRKMLLSKLKEKSRLEIERRARLSALRSQEEADDSSEKSLDVDTASQSEVPQTPTKSKLIDLKGIEKIDEVSEEDSVEVFEQTDNELDTPGGGLSQIVLKRSSQPKSSLQTPVDPSATHQTLLDKRSTTKLQRAFETNTKHDRDGAEGKAESGLSGFAKSFQAPVSIFDDDFLTLGLEEAVPRKQSEPEPILRPLSAKKPSTVVDHDLSVRSERPSDENSQKSISDSESASERDSSSSFDSSSDSDGDDSISELDEPSKRDRATNTFEQSTELLQRQLQTKKLDDKQLSTGEPNPVFKADNPAFCEEPLRVNLMDVWPVRLRAPLGRVAPSSSDHTRTDLPAKVSVSQQAGSQATVTVRDVSATDEQIDKMLSEAKELLGPNDDSLKDLQPLGLMTLKRANIRSEFKGDDFATPNKRDASEISAKDNLKTAYKVDLSMMTISTPILVQKKRRKPIVTSADLVNHGNDNF